LFGDANVQIQLQNGQKSKGEFIGTYMNHVHILVEEKIIYYACDDIISITSTGRGFSYGKGFNYDCSRNTVTADILFPPQLDPMTGEMAQMLPEVFIQVELWGEYYTIEYTTEINLSNSGLTGEIPPEIGNLTNLTDLRLYGNQLTGAIPPEIGNLTNLTRLDLENNQLTGSIPSEIGNLTNLTDLYLSSNQFTGSIPPEIGNLTNLTSLQLSYNQLTGSIPPEISNLTNLNRLWLNDNQLTGEIPENICNLVENNCYINFSNNQLCPPYPSCVEDYVGEQDTSDCP
jgi:Leucine-rich repeat (LRR) protein